MAYWLRFAIFCYAKFTFVTSAPSVSSVVEALEPFTTEITEGTEAARVVFILNNLLASFCTFCLLHRPQIVQGFLLDQRSGRLDDHFCQRAAWRNDGIDVFGRIHPEINQPRFAVAQEVAHGVHNVGAVLDARPADAVGGGELREVGSKVQVNVAIALLEEYLLPLPHHAERAVIDDGDFHGRSEEYTSE